MVAVQLHKHSQTVHMLYICTHALYLHTRSITARSHAHSLPLTLDSLVLGGSMEAGHHTWANADREINLTPNLPAWRNPAETCMYPPTLRPLPPPQSFLISSPPPPLLSHSFSLSTSTALPPSLPPVASELVPTLKRPAHPTIRSEIWPLPFPGPSHALSSSRAAPVVSLPSDSRPNNDPKP